MTSAVVAKLAHIFRSAEQERLRQAIDETWGDFDDQIGRSLGKALQSAWAQSAVRYLLDAEQKLNSRKFEQGWISALSAKRAILANPENIKRLMTIAIALRREADKITGWRAKAIPDFICGAKGELRPDLLDEPERVIEAVALLDNYFHNNYFKISLRRRHLRQVFSILWAAILVCLVASYFGKLPPPYSDTRQLGLVIIFGVLGACISVSQGLLGSEFSAKIPVQQIGAFVVWMRPAVGAAAALAALALLDANSTVNILNLKSNEWTGVVGLLAFAAGYSERFIVGAIEKLSVSQKS